MSMDALTYGKRLYVLFMAAWGRTFTENFADESFVDIWCSEWGSAIHAIPAETIKAAFDHCKMNMEWPPSLAAFLNACDEMGSGLPSAETAYQMAVRRDFSIPEVKEAFGCMTSWDWTNGLEKVVKPRFMAAWKKIIQRNRTSCANQLTDGTRGIANDNGLEDWRATADQRRRDARAEIEGNILFGDGVAGSLAGRVGQTKRAH